MKFCSYCLPDVKCQYCCHIVSVADENLALLHTKACEYVERPDASYKHVCYKCSYHTVHTHHMAVHLRKHSGDKPFKCLYCNYRGTHNGNLRRHMRIRHSETQI